MISERDVHDVKNLFVDRIDNVHAAGNLVQRFSCNHISKSWI